MKTLIVIIGGLIEIVILLALAGLLLRRWLRTRKTSADNKLLGSLHDERLKSDIILNAIDDGVVLIDEQQTIQLFNPAASKITGWPIQESTGLDYHAVLKLVDEQNKPYGDEQDPFSQVFKKHAPVRDNDAVLITQAGKSTGVSLSVSPLFDTNNRISGAVGIFRDVSQERGEEERRAEFISTASHEMRTPVAAIEGYLALALNDQVSKIDTKSREFLEKAHFSTQHLGKLFQDLLTSAKAEDGRLSSHPVVVEMGAFLEQLTNDLRFAATKKELSVEFVIGATEPTLIDASKEGSMSKVVRPLYYTHIDSDRVREAISNLFDNAVKYTESGKISIGLTGNNEVVQIYIRDSGPGIPAEDIPHLFQKFYRVDSSATRVVGGTGLGLFICRKIIELYNGRIWVESELGQGSTFFINLPRLTTQKASDLQAKEASQTPLSPITSLTS